MREILVAVGAARHLPHDLAVDVGDISPVGHPGLQIAVVVDGDVIVRADPRVGLMHRSAEKLLEARDYRQALMLANRHDWLSPFISELCLALSIESAMGITPPERATWARTLLAELTRISATMLVIGAGPSPQALAIRERYAVLQEQLTGSRVHPMTCRIGGLAHAPSGPWLADVAVEIERTTAELPAIAEAAAQAMAAYAGVGVLRRDDAIAFGVTGPIGRASGLDLDLRRDEPALAYGELADLLRVPVSNDGDAGARYRMLLEQVPVSLTLAAACVDRLRLLLDAPIDVPLPKSVRVPEGTTYAQLEGALGITGSLLVSVGEVTPWRLKLRSPSFANVQALSVTLPGTSLSDLAVVLPSMCFVLGDVDR